MVMPATDNRLYSIIVPVYNAEKTLRRCIDSILAQTYTNFELILVNDGSKDSSTTIIDEYANLDSRIIPIHQINGGVSSARNAGLSVATGYFILFADADDDIKPDWIQDFAKNIDNNQICIQNIQFVGEKNIVKSIGDNIGSNINPLPVKLMEEGIAGYLFNKLFLRDIIVKHNIRFNTQLHFREDELFVFQYLEHVNHWSSINRTNYIYYVPQTDKNYGTSATECTELLFETLGRIYNDNIPDEIYRNQAWSIKGAIVENIISGTPISTTLLTAYRNSFKDAKGLRNHILNSIILNSNRFRGLSSFIIKAINRK
ncbi:glycosyltransferase family 2 protein [Bacteroides acidifaciens]|uniref:glycosyltransferase family 2 protein n=1 Tax=Bacteroides acidifaciens TaxID=85831 RepID=UPI000F49D1CC|nr:glycosyltransferase [Muribaculaceae bacterium Isolate-110 (HZI)]